MAAEDIKTVKDVVDPLEDVFDDVAAASPDVVIDTHAGVVLSDGEGKARLGFEVIVSAAVSVAYRQRFPLQLGALLPPWVASPRPARYNRHGSLFQDDHAALLR